MLSVYFNIWIYLIKIIFKTSIYNISKFVQFICVFWFWQCSCKLSRASVLSPYLIEKEIEVRKFEKSAHCQNAQKQNQDANSYPSYFPLTPCPSYFWIVWLCWKHSVWIYKCLLIGFTILISFTQDRFMEW